MQIGLLADYPRYIESLALPVLEHWRFALPENTLEVRKAKLRSHLNQNDLPIARVAHQNGKVFGTAALRVHDLEERTDLSPWLGGALVLPAHRQKGICSALCLTVEGHAASTGVVELFLFMLDKQKLYTRLGFRRIANSLPAWSEFPGPVRVGHFLSHQWTEECRQISRPL